MAQTRPNWWAMYRKYQEFESDPHPISGVEAQCAVRMCMALSVVGLYSRQRFKSVLPDGATVEGWAVRAEQLYQYLRDSSVLGSADLVTPASMKGKYGIVYLRNCWARTGQKESYRSGDHIDLVYPEPGSNRSVIVSHLFYPAYVSNDIIDNCRDGKVRFYECA